MKRIETCEPTKTKKEHRQGKKQDLAISAHRFSLSSSYSSPLECVGEDGRRGCCGGGAAAHRDPTCMPALRFRDVLHYRATSTTEDLHRTALQEVVQAKGTEPRGSKKAQALTKKGGVKIPAALGLH